MTLPVHAHIYNLERQDLGMATRLQHNCSTTIDIGLVYPQKLKWTIPKKDKEPSRGAGAGYAIAFAPSVLKSLIQSRDMAGVLEEGGGPESILNPRGYEEPADRSDK